MDSRTTSAKAKILPELNIAYTIIFHTYFLLIVMSILHLRSSLQSFSSQEISVQELCKIWRNQSELLAALPSRYRDVMEDVLSRLEAGSLFTEESCSFSQSDLIAHLNVWLDKASTQLTMN